MKSFCPVWQAAVVFTVRMWHGLMLDEDSNDEVREYFGHHDRNMIVIINIQMSFVDPFTSDCVYKDTRRDGHFDIILRTSCTKSQERAEFCVPIYVYRAYR